MLYVIYHTLTVTFKKKKQFTDYAKIQAKFGTFSDCCLEKFWVCWSSQCWTLYLVFVSGPFLQLVITDWWGDLHQ